MRPLLQLAILATHKKTNLDRRPPAELTHKGLKMGITQIARSRKMIVIISKGHHSINRVHLGLMNTANGPLAGMFETAALTTATSQLHRIAAGPLIKKNTPINLESRERKKTRHQ